MKNIIRSCSKPLFFCIVAICTCLLFKSQAIDSNQHRLIGKVFNKITDFEFLKDYIEEEGILIGPVKDKVGFRRFSNGKNTIIFCTKYLEPKSYKILAVLNIGRIEKGVQVAMGNCKLNGKANGYLVALIKPAKGSHSKIILKTWQVELQSNRFESVSNSGIDCVMDSDD